MKVDARGSFLAVILAALVLAGCATTTVLPGLEKGKASKSGIVSMYGEPDKKYEKQDGEQWDYVFSREQDGYTAIVLNLLFKGETLDSYEVLVSKEKAPADKHVERPEKDAPLPPRQLPPRFPAPGPRPFLPPR